MCEAGRAPALAAALAERQAQLQPEDPINIQYTSGELESQGNRKPERNTNDVLCCAVLRCAVLRCAVLCCAVL